MIFYLPILLLQILCVVHAVRTGRNALWITVIIFLPIAGCLAYLVAEILPGLGGNRHVRSARTAVVQKLDPERELRAARERLETADTVDGRIRVGDALVALDRWGEALPYYREAIDRAPGRDRRTEAKLAQALFESGDATGTLALIDAMPPAETVGDADRVALLRARALDHLGRADEALPIYADIVMRFPGEEARCRYAALLLEQGRKAEALAVLTEVEHRMRRLDRQRRAAEAEMYDWAEARLRDLRSGPIG